MNARTHRLPAERMSKTSQQGETQHCASSTLPVTDQATLRLND